MKRKVATLAYVVAHSLDSCRLMYSKRTVKCTIGSQWPEARRIFDKMYRNK